MATPADEDELIGLLTWAANRSYQVRPRGAGHSFTPLVATEQVSLDLRRLAGIHAVDQTAQTVTVGAGSIIRHLHAPLWAHGLAFDNLGDVDTQTVAGAISTATHGTGTNHEGLSARVEKLRIALADGQLVECSAAVQPDLFHAARAGLGAYGVITAVTLRCVPAFLLHAHVELRPLDSVLDAFDGTMAASDHVEFYWFPHTTTAVVITRNRHNLATSHHAPRRASRLVTEEVLGNGCFAATCAVGARAPQLVPRINALATQAMQEPPRTDRSYRVFCTPRRVRFREMEYALPRAAAPSALGEIRRLIDSRRWRISFPLEVRTAAADNVWLSPAYQRNTAYIAIHRYAAEPDGGFFPAVERILLDHDGRPHLGKLHTQDAAALGHHYPRHADSAELRRRTDPTGMFTSPYINHLLNPSQGADQSDY